MDFDIKKMHDAAIAVARKGGDHTLNYFGEPINVERKSDDSPVTKADREAEEIMREEILRLFPDHGIVGEEFGADNEGNTVQWILDPIDGTKSFIHGVPLYTTLVGIQVENEPVIGVIYAPALEEICEAAKNLGARLNGEPCRVRPCTKLSEATFLSTDATTSAETGYAKPFQEFLDRAWINRTWGDAYGHMLVATGRADLMFDPILNIWDAAPLLPILKEAGGVFCDVTGVETIRAGNGLSCGKDLLPEVLEVFK